MKNHLENKENDEHKREVKSPKNHFSSEITGKRRSDIGGKEAGSTKDRLYPERTVSRL